MKNVIIMVMMLVLTMTSVFAITPDTTLRVNGEYKEVGVYTDANANITINLPNGTIDVDNIGMVESNTGRFYYDYAVGSTTGDYSVEIEFYDDSWELLSTETSTFNVDVEEDELSPLFWAGFSICVLLILLGFAFKQGLIAIMGGLGLLFLGFMLSGVFSVITIIGGALVALAGLLVESD